MIKAIYRKPTANIKQNGEKLSEIPLKSIRRQCFPHSLHVFNIILEVLARTIKQQKIKWQQVGKEDVKLSVFVDIMIVYICDPKIATRENRYLINTFSKLAGYKIG